MHSSSPECIEIRSWGGGRGIYSDESCIGIRNRGKPDSINGRGRTGRWVVLSVAVACAVSQRTEGAEGRSNLGLVPPSLQRIPLAALSLGLPSLLASLNPDERALQIYLSLSTGLWRKGHGDSCTASVQ
ncbi:hypothetical protein BHE74_00036823 [Ensete ventricosum]|nr:hypothetical protein GW17_00012546 [Ensete ventricosum]RWW56454.1 hypothetical protein BHE74_00036823 [Ensete ventricosum]RZS04770.1 hypothetical protein BHM03_00035169 [Ensete ventricosum]